MCENSVAKDLASVHERGTSHLPAFFHLSLSLLLSNYHSGALGGPWAG